MIRNAFLLLLSSMLLVACGQGRSEDKATAKSDKPDAAPAEAAALAETVLDKAAAPATIDIPALPDIVAKADDIEITGADLAKLIDCEIGE